MSDGFTRTRWLTGAQCKATAARINRERETYHADLYRYQHSHPLEFVGTFVPIWPANLEACKAKVLHLYHPTEAAIIIENLTPQGGQS